MKHLIIVGAGGMGREVYHIATGCIGYGTEFDIKGFLDYDAHILDAFEGYPPVIGNDEDYQIERDDIFISSIGSVNIRKKSAELLKSRGAIFQTLVHKNANVCSTAQIGSGCLIQHGASVGADVQIGENCMIQYNAVLGHDVIVGDYCRLDCFVMCVGGVKIKDCATIHTSAVLNHKVVVGEGATVGACSFVMRKVKPNTTVFGVPATEMEF